MANEVKESSITTDASQQNTVSDPLGLEESVKPDKNHQDPLDVLNLEEVSVSTTDGTVAGSSGLSSSSDSTSDMQPAAPASEGQDSAAEKATPGEDAAAEGTKAEDELWDEGGDFAEIPLFEELADKIAEAESKPKDIVEELSSELEAAVTGSEQAAGPEKTEEPAIDEQQSVTSSPSILPWVVSGIACLFILVGSWMVWRMYSSLSVPAGPAQVQQHVPAAPIAATGGAHQVSSAPVSAKTPAQTGPAVTPAPKMPQEHTNTEAQRLAPLEYLSLAPFLIPAQQGGDPVFFKLQVELICRDKQMKEELSRKETWVRDAIYREMKGIDLSAGVQENNINRFRRPIMDRINRELAPLYVDDVRLMGTLLK